MSKRPTTETASRYLTPRSPEELALRNQAAMRRLDAWEAEGDEAEQRATMAILRRALGRGRTLSDRKLFPDLPCLG